MHEAKGKIKEEAGKAVGNPDLQDRGTAEKSLESAEKGRRREESVREIAEPCEDPRIWGPELHFALFA